MEVVSSSFEVAGVEAREGCRALNRQRRHPGMAHADVHLDRCVLERILAAVGDGGATREIEHVVRRLAVQRRRAGCARRINAADGGQRFVVHLGHLRGVLRLVPILRHHHRDDLADEAHPLAGDRMPFGDPIAIGGRRLEPGADRADVRRQILAREHRNDARRRAGGGDVHPHHARVRMGASHERHVGGPRQPDIVHVAPFAAKQGDPFRVNHDARPPALSSGRRRFLRGQLDGAGAGHVSRLPAA